ncbi:unnamed protein product (macronuclear) [Paramecium tetraurelia]|uniref:Transmembrane protein n=1 Tax=Paramecium tetraurelia TaxID=5888 RepID=A0C4Y7_PARTE|nr:uncharacterized protein GSPATT00006353001 [Paramecium tetraurelia]CAK65854.1 unnamed protein product [Paramecium tetraurelia]|eukprot:XP_001433251.1 hypothetical protein (macronuclear) [Paramecium tetraurelia strain d4-2]
MAKTSLKENNQVQDSNTNSEPKLDCNIQLYTIHKLQLKDFFQIKIAVIYFTLRLNYFILETILLAILTNFIYKFQNLQNILLLSILFLVIMEYSLIIQFLIMIQQGEQAIKLSQFQYFQKISIVQKQQQLFYKTICPLNIGHIINNRYILMPCVHILNVIVKKIQLNNEHRNVIKFPFFYFILI